MEGYPIVYAVKHKDFKVRINSRSGGIFTAISDYILDQHGVVYGCVLTDDFKAVHVRATTKNERDRMRGSKYIQSHMDDCYKSVLDDLQGGFLVLFSGTSCQIHALQAYLQGKWSDRIIYVDIVCHGVPSERVWQDYIKWQERRSGAKCTAVDFRNKIDFGWEAHIESVETTKGRIDSEVYAALFYKHHILRPSCYVCPYKSVDHPGDVTIADYWGIEEAAPGFDDNQGVSLVLINNKHGEVLFEKIAKNIECVKTDIEKSMQPPLKAPFEMPKDRERFWEEYNTHDFGWIANKYGNNSLKMRIRKALKYKLFRIKQQKRLRTIER